MADGDAPTISTHVLDTERGLPAEGIRVRLFRLDVPNGPNLPAVGAAGRSTPLGTFLGVNPFQP